MLILVQILTLCFGTSAIWFLGRLRYKLKILGCILGLISQLFWLILFRMVNTPVMYIAVIIYIGVWIDTFRHTVRNK